MSEDSARAAKVDRLMEALCSVYGETPDPEVVARLGDSAWSHLEAIAKTNPASVRTRELLVHRVRTRFVLKHELGDPFQGLR